MKRKYAVTERNVLRLLKPELFEIWLNKYPEMSVGSPRCNWSCPIRMYLADHLRGEVPTIGIYSVEMPFDGCETDIVLEWVALFVGKLDACTLNVADIGLTRQIIKEVIHDLSKQPRL
jgi:hypothetical protein